MRCSWLILDADGTLLDFAAAERWALEHTPEDLGLNVPPAFEATYASVNAELWSAFEQGQIGARDVRTRRFKEVFRRLRLEGDPDTFSESFLQNIIHGSTFMHGAERLLARLHGCIGLVLMTNGFSDVQRARIDRLGMGTVFDHVIISEEVGVAKPQRAIFDLALERIGQPDRNSVMIVGDSLASDIQGGINSGLNACWFNPKRQVCPAEFAPTYEIASLDALTSLLGLCEGSHA
jgi:2-haloacid dehalogenase